MLRSLQTKWKNRKKYATFSDMPDWMVATLALSGFLVAGYYGFLLVRVIPVYLTIANKIPLSKWSWNGWLLSTILATLGLVAWYFGSIARRCNGILRDRWFK